MFPVVRTQLGLDSLAWLWVCSSLCLRVEPKQGVSPFANLA